jgi:hypothetical protein
MMRCRSRAGKGDPLLIRTIKRARLLMRARVWRALNGFFADLAEWLRCEGLHGDAKIKE